MPRWKTSAILTATASMSGCEGASMFSGRIMSASRRPDASDSSCGKSSSQSAADHMYSWWKFSKLITATGSCENPSRRQQK